VASILFHSFGGPGRGAGLLAFLGAGIVLWMAAGRIARRIARPLGELLRVTQEIGAGRLSARARLPQRHIGEIALLGRAINDMAARIERQIGDQRELLAGVSHEIRTPLARIRVLIDLGRRGDGAGSGGSRTWDELEREVLEIDALVGELLASARLDFAALSVRSLDAREVAARALERAGAPPEILSVEASAAGAAGAADLRFDADPTLLARALANLLDNARRHGGGARGLVVGAGDAEVSFEVLDQGPGFAEGTIPAERPEGSLGLGLVLVRRIADAHHGKLSLTNRPDGGASARLVIPRSRPAA
jgi:signal transduction histidine kinase